MPTPHDDLYADINGAKLCYQIAGQGHTRVLVHAGVADKRVWDGQFDVFAERFRGIRYGQRGFGKSSMPEDAFSYMDDLHGVLDLRGAESAYVIGVSMGG